MKITKDNLNEVLFENHDARLLIADVVTHTSANLYYYHDIEITVQKALDIWHKAQAADWGRERVLQRVLPGIFQRNLRRCRQDYSMHLRSSILKEGIPEARILKVNAP